MFVQIIRLIARLARKKRYAPRLSCIPYTGPLSPWTGKSIEPEAAPKITSEGISSWLYRRFGNVDKPTQVVVPFELEVVRPTKTHTILELKTRFYKWHTEKLQKPGWSKPVKQSLSPITCVLNPAGYTQSNGVSPDIWVVVYYKSYYVRIEQNVRHPLFGPHAAKLYLQTDGRGSERNAWLGTTQFEFPFASEAKLRVLLKRSIRLREYFTSEENEENEVIFDDERASVGSV